jgi:TP901 family phage tail tape measure protein
MDSIASATAKLTLDGSGFNSGILQAQRSLLGFSGQVASTALGFTGGMGLMTVIDKTRQAVVASVKDWAEYEKAMLAVSTLVDTQKVNMAELSDQVVELSNKYGWDKKGLASALYETLSAGVEAGKSMQFLETSVKAAIGGVTDAKTVVDGLTSAIAAYGEDTAKAEEFSDSMFTTVKVGKTTIEELSGTMGQVAPLAKATGMSFDELGSSIATLTLSGLSTSEAGTAMRGMLNAIIQPSDEAKKMAKELGIEFDITAVKSKGFAKWLEDLMMKTGGSTKALSMLFPEVRGLNGAIQLTGDGFLRFNDTMDEMGKKAGATTEAADKMKEALSYKWDTAVTNMKNLGSGIGDYLEKPLKSALDKFNIIVAKSNELRDKTANLDEGSNLELLLKRRKELADFINKEEDSSASRGNQPGRWLEGLWKEADAIDELIKKKQDEAAAQKIVNDNAEAARKLRQDQIDSAKKLAEAEADAAAKRLETQKSVAEKEKENSDLIKRIDNERLQTTEQISRLQTQSYLQEIEQSDKRRESLHDYNKIEMQQNIESLQSKFDNEALSATERLSINKDLFNAKKKLIESDRQNELDSLKLKTEAEKAAAWERVKAAEGELDKLEVAYKQNELDIKKSSVANKNQKLTDLKQEYDANVSSLRGIVKANESTYSSIETKGKQAADNIGKEFNVKVGKEFKASVEASLKINSDGMMTGSDNIFSGLLSDYSNLKEAIKSDDGKLLADWGYETKEAAEKSIKQMKNNIALQFTSLFSQTSGIVTSAIKNMKSDLSVGIESLVGDIGHAVGAAGESAGNVWVAVIGEVVGTAADVLAMLDEEYDIWGNKAEEAAKKSIDAFDKINQSLDLSIRKTSEWLGLVQEKDYSNMSKADLKNEQSSISNKMAEMVSSSTGVQITGQDWMNLTTLPSDRYISADQSVLDAGLKNGNLTQGQYDTLQYVRGLKASNGISTMDTYSGFSSAISKTKSSSSSAMFNIQSALNNNFNGIDPISSQSKDDFLSDLQTQLDTKKITEQQYNDLYYQAVSGTGNFKGRKWGGMATSDWFSAEEKAKAEFNLTNVDSSQSSSGSSLLNSLPSVQSAPVSIVGQDAIASAMAPQNDMNININVNNYIDPNIPINQDTALVYSEQIASSLSRVLIAKGAY